MHLLRRLEARVRTSSTFCDYRRLLAPGRGPSELSQQVRALLTLQEGRARAASRGQALTSISPARPPPRSSASKASSDHGPHPALQVHDLGAGGAR